LRNTHFYNSGATFILCRVQVRKAPSFVIEATKEKHKTTNELGQNIQGYFCQLTFGLAVFQTLKKSCPCLYIKFKYKGVDLQECSSSII